MHSLVFSLGLFAAPVVADERPLLAAEVEGDGVARPGPVDVRLGQRVFVHLVVPLGGSRYLTDAARLAIGSRRIPAAALVRPSEQMRASVVWSRIEPEMFHLETREPYSNSVLFG